MDFGVEPFVAAEIAYRREHALRSRRHRDEVAQARAARGSSGRWPSLRRR